MGVKELEHLSEEQRSLVFRTPALLSVLVAGADHDIDQKEIVHAIKAVHYRSLLENDFLQEYYRAIEERFEHETYHIIQKFEGQPEEREAYIVEELTGLNDILPKIERRYAAILLENWKSLAKSVAKSAGGFLGFETISLAESHFIDLKMITYKP
jgi:hypothetical protein